MKRSLYAPSTIATSILLSLVFVAAPSHKAAAQQTPVSPDRAQTAQPASIPAPGPATDQPYAPQPILPGGIIVTLYPPDHPTLHADRITEPEKYNMAKGTPGRIQSIVNIHNPSIEVHTVGPGLNTGTAVILAAGGGHRTLNVGSEAADIVHYLYNFGVNGVILRNRLRSDGYALQTDAFIDALQAIRLVRANAKTWNIDPHKIGIMGFSAGAELAAAAAVEFPQYDQNHNQTGDPLAGVSSRPDFVVLLYPGPTPFARDRETPIPDNTPPTFIASAGTGDRIHAIWADQYFAAMLRARVPNIEMHIYANGVHGGSLRDRGGAPFGTWQDRFRDWFRDLGFLQPPGTETKAAKDLAARR